ncbi:MAG: ribosome biogenesis GTPase Der [Anaerolineaceae bacterium]|nr:ribosome biogenesis GTPase Der [Anaerolineaceae bacterium]
MPAKSIIALIGRPNVGKSSLFNRLVGERVAITHELPGTTRDHLLGEFEWNGIQYSLVDTGGIELRNRATQDIRENASSGHHYLPIIREQALAAARLADCVIFMTDAQTGVTAADQEIAQIMRKSDVPVIVVANKIDHPSMLDSAMDAYSLGLGEVFPISAIHSLGIGDLLDEIGRRIEREQPPPMEDESSHEELRVAIVGRPNVGKSSLLNCLLGEDRAIVSEHAGTTRDALDSHIRWHGHPVTLIDTAGIRRRGKVEPGVEKFSVLRAIRAISRAEVALLLIDATERVTEQDEHIAGHVKDAHCSLVIVVNKWDAIPRDSYTMLEMEAQIRERLNYVAYAPVVFVSAKTGQRIHRVLETAHQVWQARYQRIQTAALNQLIRDAVIEHAPPNRGSRRLKIRYVTQVAVNPPLFLFHINDKRLLHFNYERYLENRIRNTYDFVGTPLRFSFRESGKS